MSGAIRGVNRGEFVLLLKACPPIGACSFDFRRVGKDFSRDDTYKSTFSLDSYDPILETTRKAQVSQPQFYSR